MLDTFMAATDFMRGAAAAPWWKLHGRAQGDFRRGLSARRAPSARTGPPRRAFSVLSRRGPRKQSTCRCLPANSSSPHVVAVLLPLARSAQRPPGSRAVAQRRELPAAGHRASPALVVAARQLARRERLARLRHRRRAVVRPARPQRRAGRRPARFRRCARRRAHGSRRCPARRIAVDALAARALAPAQRSLRPRRALPRPERGGTPARRARPSLPQALAAPAFVIAARDGAARAPRS